MNSLSNLNIYDVFFTTHPSKHYYVCIYSQYLDKHNKLISDVYGLIITTNPKYQSMLSQKYNDYNVPISLGEKNAFVCCDKIIRIENSQELIKKKYTLSNAEKARIRYKLNKFIREIQRQGMLNNDLYNSKIKENK